MVTPLVCSECAVRDQALCGSLSDKELVALNNLSQRRRVSAGETVMWAGDENLHCANIVSGVLKMVASTADGREQIVGLLQAADFVGEPYAEQIDFTTTALTDAVLCVFPRRSFERLLEDHARLEHLLLQRTLKALNDARNRMLTLARRSAGEKVAGLLLDMADRAGSGGCRAGPMAPLTFDLPLTRGQMADVLGLTIETVSRQLTKLKGAGVIAVPGGRAIIIANRDALEARAEAA